MKKITSLVLFLAMYLGTFAQGEIVSYYKINSLNFTQLDSILNIFNAQGLIAPSYELDVYKVLYKTSYRHIDSLVTVSGAMVVPKNTECPVPFSIYMHGTASDRTGVPSYGSTEINIGLLFGMLGNIVVLPDYLGLGDSDTSVVIHPYIHAWSQANTSINMIRAGRHLEDSLGITDNGQLFLFGYSQGGFATAATLREIETNYPTEFEVTAAAPMSGAFDLKGAQRDLIISDSVYATPGYLPYVVFSYQSIYQNLYDSVQQVFKSPYDSILPALFYPKNRGIGYINNQCTPVPKHMLQDTTLASFIADSTHPLRVALAESDLLDWAPQTPIKLFYCEGDEQVTYLNSENAFDTWTANGAPNVEKQNLGNFTHGGCVDKALINGLAYFNTFRAGCVGITEANNLELDIYPNPTAGLVVLQTKAKDGGAVTIQNLLGQQVYAGQIEPGQAQTLDLSYLTPGTYIVRMVQGEQVSSKKLIVR